MSPFGPVAHGPWFADFRPMPSAPLPESLLQFLHSCVPTYQAAEVLLFLAANPDSEFSRSEIVASMRPVSVTDSAVSEYITLFTAKGLVTERDHRYRYAPAPELEAHILELSHAYNHRPVSLIQAIYRIADSKNQSFADAFKLRKDGP